MFILQPALLTLQLLQQRTANATDANHKHFDNLIGIEQHLMSNAHASGRIIVIYHDRD
ncbi:Uncharacterised protein [Shigella sonnei]|nr:Uncharacterised protein [Shigella sonnei]CSP63091.1 Uncharacterised protein [Shigella sonnei]